MPRLENGTLVIFWSPVCIHHILFISFSPRGSVLNFCGYHFSVFLYLDLSWQIWNLDDWIKRWDLWRDWKISFLVVCIYIIEQIKSDANHFTSQRVKNQEKLLFTSWWSFVYPRKIKFISVSGGENGSWVVCNPYVPRIISLDFLSFGEENIFCALAGPTLAFKSPGRENEVWGTNVLLY